MHLTATQPRTHQVPVVMPIQDPTKVIHLVRRELTSRPSDAQIAFSRRFESVIPLITERKGSKLSIRVAEPKLGDICGIYIPNCIEDILKKSALDKTLARVNITELNGKRRFLERYGNWYEFSRHMDLRGGFTEDTVKLPFKAYISQLAILLENVVVEERAVVMGHRIIKGSQHIPRYEKDWGTWPTK